MKIIKVFGLTLHANNDTGFYFTIVDLCVEIYCASIELLSTIICM